MHFKPFCYSNYSNTITGLHRQKIDLKNKFKKNKYF